MDYITAKEKAVRYIGISKKTEQEVIRKLKTLDVDEEVISKIINDLKEIGYIDDIAYSNSYILECSKMKKYSLFEIKQKLLQKGIKKSIIGTSLEKLIECNYEAEVVSKIKISKSRSMDEMKLRRYLYTRGFKNIDESECF